MGFLLSVFLEKTPPSGRVRVDGAKAAVAPGTQAA